MTYHTGKWIRKHRPQASISSLHIAIYITYCKYCKFIYVTVINICGVTRDAEFSDDVSGVAPLTVGQRKKVTAVTFFRCICATLLHHFSVPVRRIVFFSNIYVTHWNVCIQNKGISFCSWMPLSNKPPTSVQWRHSSRFSKCTSRKRNNSFP